MKVKAHVYVIHDGRAVLLRPGDTVPAGVKVTNPDVIEPDAKILPAPAPKAEEEEKAPAPEPAPAPAPSKRRTSKAATS